MTASGKNSRAQDGAFFVPEEYGFSMHFATQSLTNYGTKLENWYRMAYRQDFIDTLETHGRLPTTSYRDALEINQKLIEENKQLKRRLEA